MLVTDDLNQNLVWQADDDILSLRNGACLHADLILAGRRSHCNGAVFYGNMILSLIHILVLATAATWPIMLVLNKFEIAYLQTIVFILVIAALVQFVEMVLKKFIPALHKSLGVYLPLITTNCAVLGVCILSLIHI